VKCEFCKGKLENKLITYNRFDEGLPVIIENVPALVCLKCGGEILTPPVLDAIKKVIGEKKPEKEITIPVYDLSKIELGDMRYNSPEYHTPSRCIFSTRTDLRTLKKSQEGKSETQIWIKGGNNIPHPDEGILKELNTAFSTTQGSKVKHVVTGTSEGGYIVYEIKEELLDEQGKPTHLPVAKMIYGENENLWQLYWIWRSGIWQEYGNYPDLNHVVDQIKEDKLRFCA